MDNNKKRISLTVYIITLIFMLVIIAILGYIIVKKNNSSNNNVNNITTGVNTEIESNITTAVNTENVNTINTSANTENVNNESSNVGEVDNIEELQKILEKYLYIYSLKDTGATILTRDEGRFPYVLDFYKTYDELEKDLKKSKEKIIDEDGYEFELYKTSIQYSEYKEKLLNYMSENLFEENFTRCQKDINGIL